MNYQYHTDLLNADSDKFKEVKGLIEHFFGDVFQEEK